MGEDYRRAASEAEVAQMENLLERELNSGALGLSTGLEYDPGIYSETDIAALLSWPQSNICTDGSLADRHPRGAGSFTRVLGRYVRELGVISLEQAIHKMTGLSASRMGISDRGLIRPGLAADLVLFDPAIVIDHAIPQDPSALSSGISQVWVNGESVFAHGTSSRRHPGIVIRRALP